MQTNHIDIYKMLADEKDVSEQLYKDIGSFIFKETSAMLNNPSSLIIKLKGVGSWHLRKKRMEIVTTEWTDRGKVLVREDFPSDGSFNTYLDKHTQYVNFIERLKEYEKYLSIKKDIRSERIKTQVLLEPDKGENERFKSS